MTIPTTVLVSLLIQQAKEEEEILTELALAVSAGKREAVFQTARKLVRGFERSHQQCAEVSSDGETEEHIIKNKTK